MERFLEITGNRFEIVGKYAVSAHLSLRAAAYGLPGKSERRQTMIDLIRALYRDQSGATALEYGLIAALVSVAAIGALTQLGGSLNGIFTTVSTQMDAANASAAGAGAGAGG